MTAWQALRSDIKLVHAEVMTSTNIEARRWAEDPNNFLQSALFVADVQTAGRGRYGRVWSSLAGNAHFSLVFFPKASVTNWPVYAFVAVLALRRALLAQEPKLANLLKFKWPNDLLCAGKKCAGILLERVELAAGGSGALIVGVGVNLQEAPTEVAFPATALQAHDVQIERDALITNWVQDFLDENLDNWHAEWLAHASGLQQEVRVVQPGKEIVGVAIDVDHEGALRVRDAVGEMHRCMIGDVFFVAE